MRTKSLTITKAPQCRHSEHQGFVTYTAAAHGWLASCSNCGTTTVNQKATKDGARVELMRLEAPPLVP